MPSAKIILYKQKVLHDGTHPVMIQIIHDRKVNRKSTGLSCKPDEWNDDHSCFTKALPEFKDYNKKLDTLKAKLTKVLDWFELSEEPFSYEKFKNKVIKPKSSTKDVLEAFDDIITRMNAEGRIGNSLVYRDTKSDIKRFLGHRRIVFQDINYAFLTDLESFFRVSGYADSSIHIRMRTLRAVYNEAIRMGYVSHDLYPFARSNNDLSKYTLNRLTLTRNPRGLERDDIEKIKGFNASDYPHLHITQQMFLFSYYANGINFSDMAYLRWSDIYNGRIRYKRQKTKLYMDIKVTNPLGLILHFFRTISTTPYIFPILDDDKYRTPASKKDRIKKTLKLFNKNLKMMGKLLEINLNMTSYVARHTYAQILQRSGTNEGDIQHQLGHKNMKTTKAYLANLDGSRLDHLNNIL